LYDPNFHFENVTDPSAPVPKCRSVQRTLRHQRRSVWTFRPYCISAEVSQCRSVRTPYLAGMLSIRSESD